jgi:kinesin family protein 2/24
MPPPPPPAQIQLAPTSKHQVVIQNEEIERKRDERRARQAEERRLKEDLAANYPGNKNLEFLQMIREFRSTLDFHPLKMTDPVIDDRICVCIRKRPLSKKELNHKEIEVGVF